MSVGFFESTPTARLFYILFKSEMDAVFTIEVLESLMFFKDFVGANVHYHFDDPGAEASTNTRKRGTYAGGGTLERSVRSVGWSVERNGIGGWGEGDGWRRCTRRPGQVGNYVRPVITSIVERTNSGLD